jgi:hypothetical protein
MPQQDADASEVNEAEEVPWVSLVARDEAAEVVQPREQALDLPAALVAAKSAAVLGGSASAIGSMGRDQLHRVLLAQPFVQTIAVVGAVSDQAVGRDREEAAIDRLLDERDLVGRSACDANGDRKTSAVCNCHDLGPLPALSLSDAAPPFLAPAKVPSMNASLRSIFPRA